jgi:hypothetical protein
VTLDPITAGIDLANTVVGKLWPDKSAQEQAQLAAAVALVQGQLDINKAEAASPSMFVGGWRPACGWVCAAALGYQYLARPLLPWACAALGHAVPELPTLDGTLMELLAGMLGLGGLRTVEKIKSVAR